MATRFRALSAPVDASTGDRRRFAENALTHQPLPMPLRWTRHDVGGHDGAITIGSIQKIDMDEDEIWVEGTLFDDVDRAVLPRLAEDVAEATKLINEGVLGLSVDLDDFEAAPVPVGSDTPVDLDILDDPDTQLELLITKGRIRSATLVAIPAYVETNHTIELSSGDPSAIAAITATVLGEVDLPVASREREWDGAAAATRVFNFYTNGDTIDTDGIARAFLYRDPDADPTAKSAYKLGFADIIDDQLHIVPRGVAAAAGGRGVDAADIPQTEKTRIKTRICSLYDHIQDSYEDWPDCPYSNDETFYALVAAQGPELVPVEAFTPYTPITGPTPITYDWEKGQVYGHVALWGTCHQGFSDQCVLAPRDPGAGYRDFHTYRVETTDGTIYAGRITAGGRHPSTDASVDAHAVRAHHNTMSTVAHVRATEDEYGIFVCGPIEKDLDEKTLRILSRRKVSPDWRETTDGLSMIEVLALAPGPRMHSEPGFPVQVGFSGGRQIALTAALGPDPDGAPKRDHIMDIVREAVAAVREEDARQAAEQEQRAVLATQMRAVMDRDRDMQRRELAKALQVGE
jgi:hypothetical protein